MDVKWQSEDHWAAVNTNYSHVATYRETNRAAAEALVTAHDGNLRLARGNTFPTVAVGPAGPDLNNPGNLPQDVYGIAVPVVVPNDPEAGAGDRRDPG